MASSSKDKSKKLEEGPESTPLPTPEPKPEPIPQPDPKETLWTSKAWDRKDATILQGGQTDPLDKRFRLQKTGEIPPQVTIQLGVCNIDAGSSPRLYIDAPNVNVKFSAEIKVLRNVKEIYLVARSNHEDRPKGFGGYYYYLNFKDKKAYFKKEITHEDKNDNKTPQGYSSRLDEHPIDFKANQWYKAELFILNDFEDVKLEGYFDEFPINDFLDDGTIQCGNDHGTYPNTKPFQGVGKNCFLRINEPDGVQFRNVKVEAVLTPTSTSMPKVSKDI